MKITPVIFALVLLFSASGLSAQADISSVQRLETKWADSLKAGYTDELAELYDREATLTLPGAEPVVGKQNIRTTLRAMVGALPNLQLTTMSVLPLSKEYHLESGVGHYDKSSSGGATQAATIHYQVLWKCKRNGQCTIVRDIASE